MAAQSASVHDANRQPVYVYEHTELFEPLGVAKASAQPPKDDGVHFIEFKSSSNRNNALTSKSAARSSVSTTMPTAGSARRGHKRKRKGERQSAESPGDEDGELELESASAVNANGNVLLTDRSARNQCSTAQQHPAKDHRKNAAAINKHEVEEQEAVDDNSSSSLEELRPPHGTPPWAPGHDLNAYNTILSPMARLHKEIVDLERFVMPTQPEQQARESAINRVSEVARSIWPRSRLEPFGSYKTGLYLPTSDVDGVILNSGCDDEPKEGLKAYAIALTRSGAGKYIQLITSSKVPIVKFMESQSGLSFDVSFEVGGGPAAAEFVKEEIDRLPALKPLAIVIKLFLQQRDMNEVYTGGLGSYALLVMLISFLRQHPRDDNLGFLLLRFFELYGRQMDPERVGISCKNTGGFFDKVQAGYQREGQEKSLFSIEDPYDSTNDLGQSSFNAKQIRSAFSWAVSILGSPASRESILLRILRMDDALALRQPLPAEQEAVKRRRERRQHRKRDPSRRRGGHGGGPGSSESSPRSHEDFSSGGNSPSRGHRRPSPRRRYRGRSR